jgi:hypothetical protein
MFSFTLILALNLTAQQRGQDMASTSRDSKEQRLHRNEIKLILNTAKDYDEDPKQTWRRVT